MILWPTSCVSGVQGLSNSVPFPSHKCRNTQISPRSLWLHTSVSLWRRGPSMQSCTLRWATWTWLKSYLRSIGSCQIKRRSVKDEHHCFDHHVFLFFFPKKYPWKNNVSFHNYRKNMLTTSYEIRKHLFKVWWSSGEMIYYFIFLN